MIVYINTNKFVILEQIWNVRSLSSAHVGTAQNFVYNLHKITLQEKQIQYDENNQHRIS